MSILIDELGVTRSLSNGTSEAIAWTDLREVLIVTTDAGPVANDVFWVLAGTETGCVVPARADGAEGLLERLQSLPGFDSAMVVRAMASHENARFPCWRKDAPTALKEEGSGSRQ